MKCKNILIKVLVFILLIIFIVCSYFIIQDFIEYEENEQITEELIETVIDINSETDEITIDWDNLRLINKDIVGWIEIEGTKINYPILKDIDNPFYLKHSFNKKYNENGSIFTTNKNPFVDEETIIYGHNMKNRSMFSMLDNYLNKEFLYSHLNIKIYTPTENYNGTIFSAYSIGIETENNNIKNLNFNERIDYYKKISKYPIDITCSPSKTVKLSTCSYINTKARPTDQRYYIISNIEPIK